ncbi:hypothetical protein ABBQ38_002943 [Trebouxia sp. C0009 RCD-2024]
MSLPSEQNPTMSTTDQAAQAVQALFQFLGNACSLHGAKQPFRAIQEPELTPLQTVLTAKPGMSALRMQQARKAAGAMDLQVLNHKLSEVHCTYNTRGEAQGMNEADFLHLLYDCHLLTNKQAP